MPNLYRSIALSDHWLAQLARWIYRWSSHFSAPAPRLVTRPVLGSFLLLRAIYYFMVRVFICEPLFKASCTSHGHNLHTGVFLHRVYGNGDLIAGNDVTVDGKCRFFFAAADTAKPALRIGDHTGIGHNCAFWVRSRITIGRHCRIANDVQMFDSAGYPSNRRAGMSFDDAQPISIGDNVWIGSSAIISPGVTIGDGSIVAMATVVMSSVPPNTLVAGNPARQVRSLARSHSGNSELEEVTSTKHV